MLVIAHQGQPIRDEQDLFDAYIEKQLHDPGNQGIYRSGRGPKTTQTRHYLVWLAKQLESSRETEFLIERLQPSLLPSNQQRNFYRLSVGLSNGLIFGLGDGLIVGLIVGLRADQIQEKALPNQGIWRSIQNGLKVGLSVVLIVWLSSGLSSGLSFWLSGDLIFGLNTNLILALIFGLIFGMSSGLGDAIKHLVLRIFLTKNGYMPWDYARFLEHAVKHRFIQRTGGRYRFVHDLLRKHFAAMPLD